MASLLRVFVSGHAAGRVVRLDVAFGGQHASHVGRAVRVALLGREVSGRGLLEVSGLRKYHQFIERVYTEPREGFQARSEADPGKKVHQFLEG
jgi:hypothetical protein